MPCNVSALMDESYNYSMWVEIYNSGTTSTNQASYYFSDTKTQPTKWRPAYKSIEAGKYSILWFEREELANHANFKIEPEGGKLFLFNSSLQLIDSVKYPKQIRNVSYGRITDGADDWVFFERYSPAASNNNNLWSYQKCDAPVFNTPGGFYPSAIQVGFTDIQLSDTIYYTLNGNEPTKQNSTRYIPGSAIQLNYTSMLRAKSFSGAKLSSNVVTSTYFIGSRKFTLPVVSIVTNQANLTDNTIGIYVAGTNGITGNGSNSPVNWNRNWDRPANFELFDTTNTCRINQELDISISGGWSRLNGQKSLKISPRSKFGNNKLPYDIFAATKPNRKYKDIQIRNSGNDFSYSMMRDAFMQALIINRMDIDYLAYEPAVCFLNGVYYGIQNLRERSSKDYFYSNYGYSEEDIYLLESGEIPIDDNYKVLSNYITNNDISKSDVFDNVCEMMDVDNYINYMISQIYYANTDWPHNNVKIWKKRNAGKWRWLLYDTDFGFNLYGGNPNTYNSLTYALGEYTQKIPEAWSTLLLRRLVLNDVFRSKFINRFAVQLSTTFEPNRVNKIADSLSAKIGSEIIHHKTRWNHSTTLSNEINRMKTFSAGRPTNMLSFISARFLNSVPVQTINLSSNISNALLTFNNEALMDTDIQLKHFANQSIAVEAKPVRGYKFKRWEQYSQTTNSAIIPMGSNWKYFDGNAMPTSVWFTSGFNDTSWKSGNAQLGYGGKGEVTTIGYGGVSNNKYPTAYFRKTVSITGLENKNNFSITILVDDGAAVYVNGQEIGRYNLPTGTLAFNTFASTYNNGEQATFSVPKNLLVEGNNLIAVEVHQNAANSSDLMFNLEMNCEIPSGTTNISQPIYNSTLTQNISLKAIYEISDEEPEELPAIIINEILASNSLIADEFGNFDDYIELYNNGATDVNIAGWYLTDSPTNKILSQIPTTDSTKTNIPAHGRIIIWADGQQEQGVLHVGFKLGKEGETIVLSRKNRFNKIETIDSITFPPMSDNLTYSRVPDGSENWYIRNTTFNLTNGIISGFGSVESSVRVYPTLVKDNFTITNASGMKMTVCDLTGKVLIQKQCFTNNEIIQIEHLKRGMYLLVIGNTSFKLIKL